jgi:hypothetical protein
MPQKPHTPERVKTHEIINDSGPDAAQYVADVLLGRTISSTTGKKLKVTAVKVENAWRVIYQIDGKPRQNMDLAGQSGGPTKITYVLVEKSEETTEPDGVSEQHTDELNSQDDPGKQGGDTTPVVQASSSDQGNPGI